MRLLVSVRSADEAVAAAEGGADVIDAKEPARGALGAVSPDVLREIRAATPPARLVTAALGDAHDETAIGRLAFEYSASGAGLVKVGFAAIADVRRVERLIVACVRGCERGNPASGVVAVAYADAEHGTSIDATKLLAVAAHAGARGVLVDTADKEGAGLTTLWSRIELSAWVGRARGLKLIAAVAGKLGVDDLGRVRDAGADVAGVRSAACIGGRSGRVSADLVRGLRTASASRGDAQRRDERIARISRDRK